jgi:hypothetical protein
VAKTYEELLAIEPLSKCLQKVSCAVEASGPQELRDWLRLELAGYYSSNKALTEDTVVPEYRTVVGQHVDLYGRVLQVPSESSFINEMRLRAGIEELEGLADSRNTVVLHDATLCELIQQHLGVEVYYFQFSATSLKGIFSAIRSEAIDRLNRLPHHPPFEKVRQTPADEIIQLRPNIYGIGFDLRAMWRKVTQSREGKERK